MYSGSLMDIKSRSQSLGPGPNVGALSALHRDEWSSLFPMLNEYGLNSESVRAMTTAVSFVLIYVCCSAVAHTAVALQLCAISLDQGGGGNLTDSCRQALYNNHENRCGHIADTQSYFAHDRHRSKTRFTEMFPGASTRASAWL
jgi:hypothetical protein